ncbi:MAG TPA: transcription termination/antitermination NusG family protein [Kaistia sp.]|jgi:transcriptional antiterminator RfaH|nr:transcription termination/antitermination NusG family protein [Kaistia sp.]
MIGWHVAYTHAGTEARAESNLRRQGFATYTPRVAAVRRHAWREEVVRRPLFSRYVFVSFDPLTAKWRPMLGTVGVMSLLRQHERPAPISAELVEGLRRREAADEFELRRGDARLVPGSSVRVESGPFAELIGRIELYCDVDRVKLLLSLLGCEVGVELPAHNVRAL